MFSGLGVSRCLISDTLRDAHIFLLWNLASSRVLSIFRGESSVDRQLSGGLINVGCSIIREVFGQIDSILGQGEIPEKKRKKNGNS